MHVGLVNGLWLTTLASALKHRIRNESFLFHSDGFRNSDAKLAPARDLAIWPPAWSWPFSSAPPPCAAERREDGSCALDGCELESNATQMMFCKKHPQLGLGECRADDIQRISDILHDTAHPHQDVVTLIRRLGANPVYHDMHWTGHETDIVKVSPPNDGWQTLHERGLYLMRGFISNDTADDIVAQVKRLPQHGSGIYRENYIKCEFRKSTTWDLSANFDVLPQKLRKRIAKKTGTNTDNFELLQAARYLPGEFYSEHFDEGPCDHFNNGTRVKGMNSESIKNAMLKHSSCDGNFRRDGTFLLYLTGTAEHEGGATFFPRLGVRVPAEKGTAIFFRPTHSDGSVDPLLLHTAEVLTNGAKFVIQQWIRNPSLPVLT